MMLPCFLLIIVRKGKETVYVHVFFEQRPTAVGFRAQTKAPSSNPELVEFQPGQVMFRTPLTCPPLRVQAIHPETKSLTKTNKM